MSWEWILGIWTCIGIAWWVVAFVLVIIAGNRRWGEMVRRGFSTTS